AQDQRVDWRAHVEADNIPHLLDKVRIFGKLKGLAAMRFEPKSSPDTTDGGLAQTQILGHHSCAPMSGSFGFRFKHGLDCLFDFFIFDFARRSRPGFVPKRADTATNETIPPVSDSKWSGSRDCR